jgi:hypothetical protein
LVPHGNNEHGLRSVFEFPVECPIDPKRHILHFERICDVEHGPRRGGITGSAVLVCRQRVLLKYGEWLSLLRQIEDQVLVAIRLFFNQVERSGVAPGKLSTLG